jgi:hypothetical protein
MTVSELSGGTATDPVVGIPYPSYNVQEGILQDQLMGDQYFLAGTTETESYASKDPELQYLGSTPGTQSAGTIGGHKIAAPDNTWKLYLIKNSPLVSPLSYDPEVETGLSGQAWENLGILWYNNQDYWKVPIALGGPSSWPHPTPGTLVEAAHGTPVQPTTVSNIVSSNESISFDVSTTGAPVVVKIPYFPNWQATGAEGPWEISPNLMVVIPTSHHVVLTFGISHADIAGYVASGLGVGMLITFGVMGPVTFQERRIRIRRRGKHSRGHIRFPYDATADATVAAAEDAVTESVPAVGMNTEEIERVEPPPPESKSESPREES